MSRRENLVAVITGGNTGLGFAIAKSLLSTPADDRQYTVVLTSRSLERALAAAEELRASLSGLPGEVLGLELDLCNDEHIERMGRELQERFGRVDILINNTGKPNSFLPSFFTVVAAKMFT